MAQEKQMQLRDPATQPSEDVLKTALGHDVFTVYEKLAKIILPAFGLTAEWRYYKDGKAWLCKVTNKKKTVFWLSVWDGFFKTSFFFTEKTRSGVAGLSVSPQIKEDFEKAKPTGKLVPLILDIYNQEQLTDLREIIGYKSSLK